MPIVSLFLTGILLGFIFGLAEHGDMKDIKGSTPEVLKCTASGGLIGFVFGGLVQMFGSN